MNNEAASDQLRILCGLRPEEYEHPLDRQALNALEGTPGLEAVIRKMNQYGIERVLRAQYAGSYIQATRECMGQVHQVLERVCATIHVSQLPGLYLQQGYVINAFVVGSENPMIVLTTGAVSKLTRDELAFVIGHEVGHIKSQHIVYQVLAEQILPTLGGFLTRATLGLGDILSAPIQLALYSWYRKSELTCDRAGLLACQNLDAAITAMMKIAGAPESEYDKLDPQQFLQQARAYQQLDEQQLDKLAKRISVMTRTHPWTVMRCAELDSWVTAGAYGDLLQLHRERGTPKAFCSNCGKPAKTGATFCIHCGSAV